jgi:hypothetical protein
MERAQAPLGAKRASTTAAEPPARISEDLVAGRTALRRLATLPEWLAAASDPARIHAALADAIPEVVSGELRLHGCDCERPRFKSGTWTLSCTVTVGISDEDRKELKLEGRLLRAEVPPVAQTGRPAAIGSEGWHCLLPDLSLEFYTAPPDTTLPILPQLIDPEEARDLLQDAIRTGASAYADLQIADCRPRVARYRSANRCTIVYQLGYTREAAGRGWPGTVVAKVYGGDKGLTAYNGMRALWDSELARSPAVTIAEPLAYLPDRRLLIQGPIPEDRTLKDLIRSTLRQATPEPLDELDDYMARTAAGLAALHRSGVRSGETVTLETKVGEVEELVQRLAGPIQDFGNAAEPLLAWLDEVAARHPAEPLVPAHGSFRPAQVLLHDREVGFIDFDSFCQAEPALDVALFRAGIKDIGAGAQPEIDLAALEAVADGFLRHYEAVAPISRERVMLWEAVDLLVYVLHAWTKVSPKRLPVRMASLARHLVSAGFPA